MTRRVGRWPQKPKSKVKRKLSYLDERGRPRRNEKGRIVSKDDWKLYRKEIQRRLKSKQERDAELGRLRKVRAKEVKGLRRTRHKRTHEPKNAGGALKYKYKLTQWNKVSNRVALARDEGITLAGGIPPPHEVNETGGYFLTVWRWWDGNNIDFTSSFLLKLAERFGSQTYGRVAIGTDYSERGDWVGTATLPLGGQRDLWRAYQRLLVTTSGKDIVGTVSEGRQDVWIEVELLLREDIR